jgi:hypothetical protein
MPTSDLQFAIDPGIGNRNPAKAGFMARDL